MKIVEEIEKMAKEIGMSFMFNDWSRANVDLDSQLQKADNDNKYPLCLFVLPVSGELDVNINGRFSSSYNCLIAFLGKAGLDEQSKLSFETVESMNTYARKFVNSINTSKVFDPIVGGISVSIPYDILDLNLTGVCLDITLKEKIHHCV